MPKAKNMARGVFVKQIKVGFFLIFIKTIFDNKKIKNTLRIFQSEKIKKIAKASLSVDVLLNKKRLVHPLMFQVLPCIFHKVLLM